MKLLLGLGNVGPRYATTRHNIGFMVVDFIAEQHQASWSNNAKLQADITQVEINGEKVIIAKPTTMMNLSGGAAQKILQFYKLQPQQVWAIYDDVDTPFGRLKLRHSGSAGGHQGIISLIGHIGANFQRLRVGISLNDRAIEPSEVYVLKPFNTEEQAQLPRVISQAADFIQEHIDTEELDDSVISLI